MDEVESVDGCFVFYGVCDVIFQLTLVKGGGCEVIDGEEGIVHM